jgi:hypothetical protein
VKLSNKSKEKVFEKTLALIKSEEKREWVKKVLGIFPEHFWTQPTSTTGKYHPVCSNVRSGLLIHTKRVVWFAIRFMNAFKYIENNQVTNIKVYDNIIASCILHDGFKGGKGQCDYKTYEDHPILVEQHYKEIFPNEKLELWQQEIFELIKHHMAFWGPKSVKKPIEKYTIPELIVYMADYFASRKELVTKVDTFGMELKYEEDNENSIPY